MADDTTKGKVPTPVAGGDGRKGAPDGVNIDPSDRTLGGESGGGAYPNPHTGKSADIGGFMGHGGQSEQDYSGTGDKDDKGVGNPNAPKGAE